jgi:hypothetical protein
MLKVAAVQPILLRCLIIVALLLGASKAPATQPVRFNYQSRLTDHTGSPLNGGHTLIFRIYEGGTAAGQDSGTLLYSESIGVNLTGGIASCTLGAGSTILTDSIFAASEDLFLQVAIDTPGNAILPRTRLESVPFAIAARNADSATAALGIKWIVVTSSTLAVSNRSYAVNGTSPTTVTLPASPTIGDTVRVSGVGPAGWIIGQNPGQSIFAGTITSSPLVWIPREQDRSWNSVASSGDGIHLIAAGLGTSLMVSHDAGATWHERDTNRDWSSVASSADGTHLIACENGGNVYASIDSGETWNPKTFFANWSAVASSADGTRLVASIGGGQIYTSTDSGTTWTARETDRSWSSVASASDGLHLIACPQLGFIFTTSDGGANWFPRDSGRNWVAVASSADGGRLFACDGYPPSQGQLYTSPDFGLTWTPHESNRWWTSVASSADGMRLIACAQGGPIVISSDAGETWEATETTRNWKAVASSADGTRLVAAEYGGRIYTRGPWTSAGPEGYISGSRGGSIELQFVGGGAWVPISFTGPLVAN